MKIKKILNNRRFRTFYQSFFGVIIAYFSSMCFEIDNKALLCLIVSAVATGLSKAVPLMEEE